MKDANVLDNLLLWRGLKLVLLRPRVCLAVSSIISPVQNNIFEVELVPSFVHNSAVLEKQSCDKKEDLLLCTGTCVKAFAGWLPDG